MTDIAKNARRPVTKRCLRAATIGFAATIALFGSAGVTAQTHLNNPSQRLTKPGPAAPPLASARTMTLTLTAPFDAPYKAWMRCADRAIAWAIQNGDNSGEDAGKLAALICGDQLDQLDQLRALLAREVGIVEAGRFYRRSDYNLRETAKDYWRWAHPASTPPSTKAESAR